MQVIYCRKKYQEPSLTKDLIEIRGINQYDFKMDIWVPSGCSEEWVIDRIKESFDAMNQYSRVLTLGN